MKVIRENNEIVISDFNQDDLRQLYIRVSLSNHDIVTAMGKGFGDKKLPDTAFGCQFCSVFRDTWEDG